MCSQGRVQPLPADSTGELALADQAQPLVNQDQTPKAQALDIAHLQEEHSWGKVPTAALVAGLDLAS